MRLTVLGYWGGYPEAGEATSAYLLSYGEKHYLLDCGSGAVAQLFKYVRLKDIESCFISHFHFDHSADLGVLQYAYLMNSYQRKSAAHLTIYAPATPEAHRVLYEDVRGSTMQTIQSDAVVSLDDLTVRFLRTRHPVETLAMRFEGKNGESLVYTADTHDFPELIDFARGAEVLLAESSFYADEDGEVARSSGHLRADEAARLAEAAQVERLYLTHLPHRGLHQDLLTEAKKHFGGRVALVHTGMEITW